MSYLTDNPDLMMEALAILVRRAGGSVTLRSNEGPGPFTLLSKVGPGELHLSLDENVSLEEAIYIQSTDGGVQ